MLSSSRKIQSLGNDSRHLTYNRIKYSTLKGVSFVLTDKYFYKWHFDTDRMFVWCVGTHATRKSDILDKIREIDSES
jgi:hypothetical protein